MTWGMVAVAGASLVGGVMSSNASKSAAATQAGAANAATQSQRDMFNQTQANNAPYDAAGQAATSKLSNLLGINTAAAPASKSQANFDAAAYLAANPDVAKNAYWSARPWEHYQQHGQNEGRAFTGVAAPVDPSTGPGSADYGSLLKPFGMDDFHLDPGIQFQTQQGNLALQNSQAAKNGTLSGGALKDLIGYNQGMAGTGYQSAFDRYMAGKQFTLSSLMGVAGLGQNGCQHGQQQRLGLRLTASRDHDRGGQRTVRRVRSDRPTRCLVRHQGVGNSYFLSSLLGTTATRMQTAPSADQSAIPAASTARLKRNMPIDASIPLGIKRPTRCRTCPRFLASPRARRTCSRAASPCVKSRGCNR
jgi:hypothetical protein